MHRLPPARRRCLDAELETRALFGCASTTPGLTGVARLRLGHELTRSVGFSFFFSDGIRIYLTGILDTRMMLKTPQPLQMDLAALLNSRPAKGKRPSAKRVRKGRGKAKKRCQGSKKRPAKAMPSELDEDVFCCLLLGCQHRLISI